VLGPARVLPVGSSVVIVFKIMVLYSIIVHGREMK
jgi:hypothetical protein